MSKGQPINLSASVRQRLLNLSRQRGEGFNLTLTRYGCERLLYRLSQSPYAEQFVLKGALVFAVWTERLYRPTRDIDLLGHGSSSDDALTRLFQGICSLEVVADGLAFHPGTVRVMRIRDEQEYAGQRVLLTATLGKARVPLQADVGFGDVVTPPPRLMEYPTLLGFPAPRLRVYPPETIIAEKLHAMVVLGMINSRMKDFFDVWAMSQQLSFHGPTLARAIRCTFERRGMQLPGYLPVALTAEFALAPNKESQWRGFLSRSQMPAGRLAFVRVVADLRRFLEPPLVAVVSGTESESAWPAGGPWVGTSAGS